MSIERNIVLVRVESVLVRVKMAEVLTGEYFDGENRIQSMILEGELSVVIREKSCIQREGVARMVCGLVIKGEWKQVWGNPLQKERRREE